jgi:phenylalanyl-tRNA synthetase beta chain
MKVTLRWLKELVDITASIDEISAALTSVGLEVASVESKTIPDGVIVAAVIDVLKHPNADKLSLVTVDMGNNQQLTVVCGAPGVEKGMKVPLATEGSVLAPGFTVKETVIRGVKSRGMLCSERDLGISNNHDGLMGLQQDYTNGVSLNTIIEDDIIIEVELTPNRGDCLSVLGIARELSAKYSKRLLPFARRPVESTELIESYIKVSVLDSQRCPRYMGRLVRGVTIQESPLWLKRRLAALGLRSINNVVDVTNYVLLLFGQPMHAFDYATIQGKEIVVKRAVEGQKFVTLDSIERTLTAQDLLICDGNGPTALAGIMGGLGSFINEKTENVFLECAFFDPVGIRKTSKRLDLSTDSSYRFERGVDPEAGLSDALDFAAILIAELTGGRVAKGYVDVYPTPFSKRQVTLRPSYLARILGTHIPKDSVITMLTSLQLEFLQEEEDRLVFAIPHFRHDLSLEADLVEEVGRLYGYDSIVPTVYASVDLSRKTSATEKIFNTIRSSLSALGLHETITNSLTSDKKCKLLTPDINPVVILNPLSPDMSRMRTTLLGSLLEVTAYNLNRKNCNNAFFEIGRVFSAIPQAKLPLELDCVGMLFEGDFLPGGWNNQKHEMNFYILKGFLESFQTRLGLPAFIYDPVYKNAPVYFNREVARVSTRGVNGFAGNLKGDIVKAFDIKTPVYYAQIDITELLALGTEMPQYSALPRYPAIERDFCFVMEDRILSSAITEEIYRISDLVEKVEPFDVYRGENLTDGAKSIAYAVQLRADDRTLTDKEAEQVCFTIIETMKKKYNAVLRQ